MAVVALGGTIPTYPNKVFGGSKTLELQDLVSWIHDSAEYFHHVLNLDTSTYPRVMCSHLG